MLARLRHDRFIGRNHQQYQVDSSNSRQHIAHKALVPRHIDKAQPQYLAIGGGQVRVGEAEVNRDAAPLLFLKPVSINPGQRLHQRRLSMVDVPGGP